jgi:hypothetical protein
VYKHQKGNLMFLEYTQHLVFEQYGALNAIHIEDNQNIDKVYEDKTRYQYI